MTDPFPEIRALLLRGETEAATNRARQELAGHCDDPAFLTNVAGIFIDAGHDRQTRHLVEEGVSLCEKARTLASGEVTRAIATYNLANGLLALHEFTGDNFYRLEYDQQLLRISSLYYEVIDRTDSLGLQARLNFSTVLQRQARSVEALDIAQQAVGESPEFSRVWSSLGDFAWGVHSFYSHDVALLIDSEQAYHRALSLDPSDLPYQKMVRSNLARLEKLLGSTKGSHLGSADWRKDPSRLIPATDPWAENLADFIWASGLGLNLCSACRFDHRDAYDTLPVSGFLAGPGGRAAVLPTEVNALVQGYVGARSLLWLSRAVSGAEVEVARYQVPNTNFSRRAMFLMAAFREGYGLFDRIAAILNRRFPFGLPSRATYFDRLFFGRAKDKTLEFRTDLAVPDSPGLRALLYLSASFEFGAGRFSHLRELRNDLQHSIVVPTKAEHRSFGPWRAASLELLERRVFQLLRLGRAGLFYVGEVLSSDERRTFEALGKAGVRVGKGSVRVERKDTYAKNRKKNR